MKKGEAGHASLSKAFDLGEKVPKAVMMLEPDLITCRRVEMVKDEQQLWEEGLELLSGDMMGGFIKHVLEVKFEDSNPYHVGAKPKGRKGY